MQLVQTAKEVPPFFENIFRESDYSSYQFLISDPAVIARARPLYPDVYGMGPNDILGFRNRAVPVVADVVTIGDSQTYGNNVPLELTWPGQLEAMLNRERPIRVYNMAVGAWSGLNYLEMIDVALRFQPRVVMVAFYTGNDPLTDFSGAYSNPKWRRFIPDAGLTVADAPKFEYPPPQAELWSVQFNDGLTATFTPNYRYASNRYDDPAVRAGYKIMARTAAEITKKVVDAGAIPVFTILPTKELVYADKVADDGIQADGRYIELVRDEARNLDELETALMALEESRYVDVLSALQRAAMRATLLYPAGSDGHPIEAGYRLVAESIYEGISGLVPDNPRGLVGVSHGTGEVDSIYRLTAQGKWYFPDHESIVQNGWDLNQLIRVPLRDIMGVPTLGTVDAIDKGKFGPLN
jgi:lysophospholipase L1-like esterase